MNRKFLLVLVTLIFVGLAGWLFFVKKDGKPAAADNQLLQQHPELATLNDLIAQYPGNDSLLYSRAEAYYELEAYDEALTDLNEALKLDSLQPMYYHLLADVLLDYARPNDSRRAIEVLKLANRRFPNRIPTLLKLSEFQLNVKKHGDALATLDQILQRDPQNAEAFYMAGRVALDQGDTTNALSSLQKSVILDAENRKGMPKLDSAAMGTPLELVKVGGGEQVLHFIRDCFTASTISSNGLDFSLERVILLPSSHDTWMAVAFSDAFTHLVVTTLAWACGVRVAARPVWQTPP